MGSRYPIWKDNFEAENVICTANGWLKEQNQQIRCTYLVINCVSLRTFWTPSIFQTTVSTTLNLNLTAMLHTSQHWMTCNTTGTSNIRAQQQMRWATMATAHNRQRPKRGAAAVPLSQGGAGSPSNTMWKGPRSTSVPSGVFIHPAVWPQ